MSAPMKRPAGVDPHFVLGYLFAELEHAGTISVDRWNDAMLAGAVDLAERSAERFRREYLGEWPHVDEPRPTP